LWIVGADGSHHRFLVKGSDAGGRPTAPASVPRRRRAKGTQVFVRWMDAEGASSQVTRLTETPTDAKWAPDGKAIAFLMLVPDSTPWSISLPKPPAGANWTPPSFHQPSGDAELGVDPRLAPNSRPCLSAMPVVLRLQARRSRRRQTRLTLSDYHARQ